MSIARRIRCAATLALVATIGATLAAARPAAAATPACVYTVNRVSPDCASGPSAPVIVQQPDDQTVTVGATATFVAHASGGTAVPTAQWLYSSDGGGTWNVLIGDTASTLPIDATLGESGDEFEAVFTNPLGTLTTRAATLTVIPDPTTITLSTSANPALAGNPIVLTADVSPVPDAGTVAFVEDGVVFPGCQAQAVNASNGAAECAVVYFDAEDDTLSATYSGAQDYNGSTSNVIDQAIVSPTVPAFATVRVPQSGVGEPFSYRFVTTGSPAPVVSVTAGTLPAGLRLASDGTLSGMPAAAGTARFTLRATNGFGQPATTTVSMLVRARPKLSLASASIVEGNRGNHPLVFTVRLSRATTVAVTAHWSTANGTATAGSDYKAASGTLTIQPGSTTAALTVLVLGDTTTEPNETFSVKLTALTGAMPGTATATGTIRNDD